MKSKGSDKIQKYAEHIGCGGRWKLVDRQLTPKDNGTTVLLKLRCRKCGYVKVTDEIEQENDFEDS